MKDADIAQIGCFERFVGDEFEVWYLEHRLLDRTFLFDEVIEEGFPVSGVVLRVCLNGRLHGH